MGDWQLTCNGVGFTCKVSSLFLIWDAETWSTEKKKKERVWKLFRKLDCLVVLNGFWSVYKRWVTNSWTTMESASPVKSLPQSLFVMLRLGPPKNKEKRVSCFGNWTVLLRWTDLELYTRDRWLIAEPLWSRLHPLSLFLGLDLGCEDLVHQKTNRREWNCLRNWFVWRDLELSTRDGGLKTDPQRSQFYPPNILLGCKDLVHDKKVKSYFGHWILILKWTG